MKLSSGGKSKVKKDRAIRKKKKRKSNFYSSSAANVAWKWLEIDLLESYKANKIKNTEECIWLLKETPVSCNKVKHKHTIDFLGQEQQWYCFWQSWCLEWENTDRQINKSLVGFFLCSTVFIISSSNLPITILDGEWQPMS